MPANYVLSVVYPDGNPIEMEAFGDNIAGALDRLAEERERGSIREHWMVWDKDDPERGYFDEVPE